MKNATRSLIVLLIVAMFFFISCDDTLTHDMDDDVEVDEDEQVVATRTVTWVNYDGEVLHTADVEKYKAPDHSIVPIPEEIPRPTYRLQFDEENGTITVTEDIVYQYKFKEWFSHDQELNGADQVFTATYDTYNAEGTEKADLTKFTFENTSDREYHNEDTAYFCTIDTYNGTDEDLYIPKFHDGRLVHEVSVDFTGDDVVKRLILPDSVFDLDARFKNNKHLERLVLSKNLTQIVTMMCNGCTSLKGVHIPEGSEAETYDGAYRPGEDDRFVKYPEIGDGAFLNCTDLTHIDIPDPIETIKSGAFSGCWKLQRVKMPETPKLKNIEYNAFGNCKALQRFNIPATVEEIGESAFSGCSTLSSITIPINVKALKSWTFSGCEALETVNLSNGIETIGKEVFKNCKALKKLEIPSNVEDIGLGVVIGCEALEQIDVAVGNRVYSDKNANVIFHEDDKTLLAGCKGSTIPAATEHIARHAFEGHTGLVKDPGVHKHTTLKTIGHRAFYDCLSRETCIILHTNVTKIEAEAFYRPDDDYIGYTEILSDFTDEDKTNKLFDYSANATVDRYIGIHYYSPEPKLNYHKKYEMWTEENLE
ncbi:MAG: leucine-rich repeat domain-containing protein [Sphaerochaeta sp.]